MAAWEFGMLVLDKLIGRFVPVRFVIFALVGGTGIVVHLVDAVAAARRSASASSRSPDRRGRRGDDVELLPQQPDHLPRPAAARRARCLTGLVAFYVIGAVGAFANIGVAAARCSERGQSWWLAGIAGALIGVVWNFTMSSFFTWRRRLATD